MTLTLDELPRLLATMQAEIADLRRRVEALEQQTPELLSTEEAADLLGLHANSVKHMIKTGKLAARKIGRNYKIERADVLALIASREK